MSEIKVGDKCSAESIMFDDLMGLMIIRVIGIVSSIRENGIAVLLKTPDDECWFHRKQCRRLVKVRKCTKCNGSGDFKLITVHVKCPACNGKGKVRV